MLCSACSSLFNLAIYFSYRPSQNLLPHTRHRQAPHHTPEFSAPPRKLAPPPLHLQLQRQLYLYVNPRDRRQPASQHHQRRRFPPPTTPQRRLSLADIPTHRSPSHKRGNGAPPRHHSRGADRAPPHALAEPAPAVRGPGDAGAGPIFCACARALCGGDQRLAFLLLPAARRFNGTARCWSCATC